MKSLSYLNKYLLKYKWRLLLGIIFIVSSNFFGAYMPLIMGDAVDEIIQLQETGFDSEKLLWAALSVFGLYMLFSFGKGFFLFFTRQTIIVTSRFIEYDLKNEIYNHYQKLTYRFYKKNSTGDLMNRISEDVSRVRMYLGPGIMYTINLAVLIIMVTYQMLLINVEMTLYVLIPLPIMSFLIYKVSNRMNRESENVQREQSWISTLVQETFSGIRIIKAYSRENETISQFNASAEKYKDKSMRLSLTNSLFMPTIMLLIGFSTIITIYIGILLSYEGKVTAGNITSFVVFINMLTWPFASIGWVTSIIQRAAASQERINEFLKEVPDISNPTEEPLLVKGEIEFNNVSFTYPNSGIQAIKNISFSVKQGQSLAIVGKTGSGKSSIIHLLTRQFDPQKGNILIDGVSLDKLNLADYRDQIGVVPQEVFLFSDTLANNIKFGTSQQNVPQSEIEDAAKFMHVHHNIIRFKEGYETLLGERGINLSGGQKQRVSMARAIIRNPKILVLDDCLSAVDTETEEIIQNNLKKVMKDKTSIIISHRISSIRDCDHIIVLDDGKIIEEGTHNELINRKGYYTEMYEKQLLEEKNDIN
jgi:ATP-binding cassette, subfamily B, multidrug efflux pump